MLSITTITGSSIRDIIPELAQLRITVFREFPYLYEGSLEYEQKYLWRYTQSEQCIVVIVKDNNRIVGASTGMPLANEADEVIRPIRQAGFNINEWFYFAESILLEPYRGKGFGFSFFQERERHARDFGYKHACFCAVIRGEDHPQRPSSYRALHSFWQKRGFHLVPEFQTTFSWQEIGEAAESPKPMEYWIKKI